MTITTSQKIIKSLDADTGEELELTVRKKQMPVSDDKVVKIVESLLVRYKQDFSDHAKRGCYIPIPVGIWSRILLNGSNLIQ